VIISRTPLRISFVSGGRDLLDFSGEHGGAVVSTTLDKWIHVIVAPRFEGDVRVSYSRTEIVPNARAVEHDLVSEAMRLIDIGTPRKLALAHAAVAAGPEGAGLPVKHSQPAKRGRLGGNLRARSLLLAPPRSRLAIARAPASAAGGGRARDRP
jgi:galactokinase/mevalonate kinase-like predicted kinase